MFRFFCVLQVFSIIAGYCYSALETNLSFQVKFII